PGTAHPRKRDAQRRSDPAGWRATDGGEITAIRLAFAWCRANAKRGPLDMYETFDHTADLGLRIRAADLDTLFVEAAQALFGTIVEDLATVRPVQKIDLQLQGDEIDFLLFDWLRELLYHFDAEHLLFGKFEVHVRE